MLETLNKLLFETANSYLYLRQEPGFEQPIVAKILKDEYPSPQRIIQFNNEYELTKDIEIPGIRRAWRSEKRKGKYTLLLNYIEGQTVKEAFEGGAQSLEFFLKTAIAMADALKEVHQQGIIHKDINGRNILVNPASGQVTIIDFGISSKIDVKTRHLGNPDKLEGSLAYISPEQTGRMNRVVDYRTDLYSLGVTFYEMLTGRLPFQAADSLEMVHCHLAKIPKPVHEIDPSVPKLLSDIVMKLMAKNAEDRYQSAYGLMLDLQHCLNDWTTAGKIAPFPLGRHDQSNKFQIPQKLYGRDAEIGALMDAFERAANGGLEMMLVAGYSGVGKSALIHEVHKPITARRGYFISGKYDQYQRNIPYYAIRQAFNEFCNLLLTESDASLDAWRQRILDAVGSNGHVLIDVIPHLELVTGPQPAVERLEAQEATARFNLVFQKFLRAISRAEHPLVLFIDDLQWADNASLNLLKVLLTDEENRHLLILGAYRENETSPAHPLMVMLEEAEKEDADYGAIHLSALNFENVRQLTADALNRPPEEVHDLANLIFSKTQGNAFFTVEFLKSLEEKKLIAFDFEAQSWKADLTKIKELESTDNVVELMAGKITTLPAGTQEVLKLASCIGSWFDLKVLSVIFKKNLIVTLGTLWKAVEEGLVVPDNDNYKLLSVTEESKADFDLGFEFLHDRVQQAAYSLIGEADRKATHWRIGKLMLKNYLPGDWSNFENLESLEFGEIIFDVVNQLNAGRELVAKNTGRLRLVWLNFLAGQKAKEATAYRSAQNYLGIALEALNAEDWEQNYSLAFNIHRLSAEVCYLNGDFGLSESLLQTCLEKAQTPQEKSDVYYILMLRQSLSNLYDEAIATARKGLSLLKFELPDSDLEQHIQTNMGWLIGWFGEHGVERIFDHGEMTGPDKLATIKILDNLSMPTYVSGQVNLWILHVLLKVRLSIEHGNTPETGYAFSELGLIFCILGNWDLAFPCGNLSKRLAEKFEQRSLRHKSRSFHLIANYISPWRMHYRDTLPINNESYRTGLESGELIFVGYTLFHPFYNQFYCGEPSLPVLLDRLPANIQAARKINHDLAFNTLRAMRMFILNLMDEAGDETTFVDGELDEARFLQECTEWKDFYSICAYGVFKGKILYTYRCFEEAWAALEQAKIMLAALSGHAAGTGTFSFTQALTALALCENATPEQRQVWLEIAAAHVAQFETWAGNCPANFEHKLLLIKAELARVKGDSLEAVILYNSSIESAQRYGYVQEEALANELAGRFLLKNEVPQYARPHLREAHAGYLRWGARRKARMLEEEFTELLAVGREKSFEDFTRTSSMTTSESTTQELDMVSVVKASQALSGEIVFDQLLRRMMEIVLENAGAQKAVLVLEKEENWYVEAVGEVEKDSIDLPGIPAEDSEDLPLGILNYLLHTEDVLVMDDVRTDNRFVNDPYILKKNPLSVLCMPLVHQGVVKGVIYLEHRSATSAFPARRVETLGLLSSQMAVSLQNAQLYDRQQDLVKAYARFVPHEFLRTLGHESILDVRLGDQVAQTMTVLFSDIRSYTTLSETMSPEENFNFINAYLRRIGPNITQNGGFINQYIGDGIMAMFPDPENAVKAAIGMLRALNRYNESRIAKGRIPIQTGIGMHTGNLMLGIIGDDERHDVGVISDVVNCASRIEGLTKFFGVSILITEDTLAGIERKEAYSHRFLGRVQVKGKEGVIAVYELFDADAGELARLKSKTNTLFRQGLEEYFNKNFAEAALYLKKAQTANPGDQVTTHYLRKAAMYLVGGVPEGWTGVERMEEK
jgi:predicted ATPase/class 3 adenylate cyclase